MLRSALKRWVDRGAASLGFRVIPEWRLGPLPHARDLAQLFELLKIDTVLDVGANEGGYRRFLRRHAGYRGRIVSFEPVSTAYAALALDASADPAWQGRQLALGDSDGHNEINICARSTMSSFLRRDSETLQRDGYNHLLRITDVVRKETVQVRRLDSILDTVVDDPDARIFLKCDTQGYDLQVMAGAVASLASILAIQIELSFKPIYEAAPAYDEALARLREYGFDVAGIYPVRRDELMRVVNFDCVLVNSRHPVIVAMSDRIQGRDLALRATA
jgi:FkbM family methyltransferase